MMSRSRLLSLRVSASRGYATRRPERPPPKFPDPLRNNPHAAVETLPDNVTFIHRPPPTAPSPFSTTLLPASPLLRPPTASTSQATTSSENASSAPGKRSAVPPRLRPVREYPDNRVLTEADFEEMRRLRASKPEYWTRVRLARRFRCPPFLVGQQVPLDAPARRAVLEKLGDEHQSNRDSWGERKALVMAKRQKRRSFW